MEPITRNLFNALDAVKLQMFLFGDKKYSIVVLECLGKGGGSSGKQLDEMSPSTCVSVCTKHRCVFIFNTQMVKYTLDKF